MSDSHWPALPAMNPIQQQPGGQVGRQGSRKIHEYRSHAVKSRSIAVEEKRLNPQDPADILLPRRGGDEENGGDRRLHRRWSWRVAARRGPQPEPEAERAAAALSGGHQPGVPVPPLHPRRHRAAAPPFPPAAAAAGGSRRRPGADPSAGRHPRGRVATEPSPLLVPSAAASAAGTAPLLPPRPSRLGLLRAPGPPPPVHVLHPVRALPRRRPLPRRALAPPRMPPAPPPQVLLPHHGVHRVDAHRPLRSAPRRRRPLAQGRQVQVLLLPAAVTGLRRGAHGGRPIPSRAGGPRPDGAAAAAAGVAEPRRARPSRARHRRRHGHAGGAAQEARQRHRPDYDDEPGRALLGGGGGTRGGPAACAAAAAVPGGGRDNGRGPDRARREPVDPGGGARVPVVRRRPGAAPWRTALGGPFLVPESGFGRLVRLHAAEARLQNRQVGRRRQDRPQQWQGRGLPHGVAAEALQLEHGW